MALRNRNVIKTGYTHNSFQTPSRDVIPRNSFIGSANISYLDVNPQTEMLAPEIVHCTINTDRILSQREAVSKNVSFDDSTMKHNTRLIHT
jgi:hypothetical protein